MANTYILHSQQLNKYYIGHTSGLMEERLKHHLTNHDGFTAKAKDWKVVFERTFATSLEAAAFEKKIKSWKSVRLIEQLVHHSN